MSRWNLEPTKMKLYSQASAKRLRKSLLFLIIVTPVSGSVFAQQRLSRNYPAGKDVRLELRNISGTITVETWAKDEIRIVADMETRKATFNPRQTESGLVIDIVGDNRGKRCWRHEFQDSIAGAIVGRPGNTQRSNHRYQCSGRTRARSYLDVR